MKNVQIIQCFSTFFSTKCEHHENHERFLRDVAPAEALGWSVDIFRCPWFPSRQRCSHVPCRCTRKHPRTLPSTYGRSHFGLSPPTFVCCGHRPVVWSLCHVLIDGAPKLPHAWEALRSGPPPATPGDGAHSLPHAREACTSTQTHKPRMPSSTLRRSIAAIH